MELAMQTIEENLNYIIARYLRHYRKKANLTQMDVAEFLGVSFQQIQKYEKGTNRIPFL